MTREEKLHNTLDESLSLTYATYRRESFWNIYDFALKELLKGYKKGYTVTLTFAEHWREIGLIKQ